jgi:hypothetical protein
MSGLKMDLHVHVKDPGYSEWMPGINLTSACASQLKKTTGLDGIGAVAYGSMPLSVRKADEIYSESKLFVLPGEEIKTVCHQEEGRNYIPHLIAYGLTEAVTQGRDVFETLEELTEKGAVVILAHPFLNSNEDAVRDIVGRGEVHALEINHYQPTNRKTRTLFEKLKKARSSIGLSGGSDGKIGHEIGSYWTEIGCDLDPGVNYQNNIDVMVEAMKYGMECEGTNQTHLGNLVPGFLGEVVRNTTRATYAHFIKERNGTPLLPF